MDGSDEARGRRGRSEAVVGDQEEGAEGGQQEERGDDEGTDTRRSVSWSMRKLVWGVEGAGQPQGDKERRGERGEEEGEEEKKESRSYTFYSMK